jgi:hypothetical protein
MSTLSLLLCSNASESAEPIIPQLIELRRDLFPAFDANNVAGQRDSTDTPSYVLKTRGRRADEKARAPLPSVLDRRSLSRGLTYLVPDGGQETF